MNPRFFVSARRMAVCLAMLLAMAGIASANPRPATVTMSNGKILKGNVSTTPGRLIRLYVGDKKVRKFALDAVGSIEFEAEVEKMQHKYLKGETGRGKDPILTLEEAYPLREFLVHANMLDGSKLSGAFGTAVFYVQSEGKTQKFVVKRKQTGNVGQKLEDLVYIKKIVFDDASASTPKDDGSPELDNQGRIAVRVPSAPEGAELYALSFDKLVRLKPTAADGAGQFKMDWPLGQSAWFALKAGNKITVGWPDGKTKPDEPDSDALFALTEKYLKDEPNFFTVRKVLAICRSPERRDMVLQPHHPDARTQEAVGREAVAPEYLGSGNTTATRRPCGLWKTACSSASATRPKKRRPKSKYPPTSTTSSRENPRGLWVTGRGAAGSASRQGTDRQGETQRPKLTGARAGEGKEVDRRKLSTPSFAGL